MRPPLSDLRLLRVESESWDVNLDRLLTVFSAGHRESLLDRTTAVAVGHHRQLFGSSIFKALPTGQRSFTAARMSGPEPARGGL